MHKEDIRDWVDGTDVVWEALVNQLFLEGLPSITFTVCNPEEYEELFNTGHLPDDFSFIEPPQEAPCPHKLSARLRRLYRKQAMREKKVEQEPSVQVTYPECKSKLRIVYDRERWEEYKKENGIGCTGKDTHTTGGVDVKENIESEEDKLARLKLQKLMNDKKFISLYWAKLRQILEVQRKLKGGSKRRRAGRRKNKETSGSDSNYSSGDEWHDYSFSLKDQDGLDSMKIKREKKVKPPAVPDKKSLIKERNDVRRQKIKMKMDLLKEKRRRKVQDNLTKLHLAKLAREEKLVDFNMSEKALAVMLGGGTSTPNIVIKRESLQGFEIIPVQSTPMIALEREDSDIPVKFKVAPLRKARRLLLANLKPIKTFRVLSGPEREHLNTIFKAARRASRDYTAMEEVQRLRRRSKELREQLREVEKLIIEEERKERLGLDEIELGPRFFEEQLRQTEPQNQRRGSKIKKKYDSNMKLRQLLIPAEASSTHVMESKEMNCTWSQYRIPNTSSSRSRLRTTTTYKKRKQSYFKPWFFVLKYRRMYRELQKEVAKKYALLTYKGIAIREVEKDGIMKPRRDQSSIKISDGTNKRLGSTMTFCLSSRKAYEAGWVVEREDYEADRASLLAWMSNRIKGAVKQKEQEEEVARKLGHRKPSFVRYYGDSRRDQLKKLYEKPLGRERTKTKKPTGIPQLSSITEEEDRGDKLMVQLADGSITVHYPASGDIAIVASAVSDSPGQFYVNCFDKNSERTCLGTFTPTGKACCYRTNGIPGLLLTDEGGIIKSDTDETIKRWLWPPNPKEKLCEPISYQLNREMHVKIRGKRQMTLVFTSHRETVKIQVGVEKEAANKAGKGKDKRRIQPAIKKQGKSPKIEELKRDLYFASKSFELDQRAEADLEKMQEHAKQIVEHWMESYRQTLGIPPPEMNKITELPQVKTPYRRSNSANMPVYIINQMEEKEKLQSFRCPSAPLQHSFRIKQNEFLYSSSHKAEGTNKKSSKKKKKAKESQKEKPSKTALNNLKDAKSCKINVEENLPENLDDLFAQISEKRMEVIRSSSVYSSSNSTTSSKCDFLEFSSQLCPLVTRTEIENIVSKYQTTPGKVLKCRCSKNKIPSIHDLELDYFLSHIIPKHQMVVIYITNSLYPECNYYERMLESVYIAKNKNRSIPCLQSHKDEYRILTYDLAIANQTAHRSVPLLLARHNVVPGMTLIYCRSKLLFANSIFNGYGTTRSDFLKQISISSLQRKQKCYLPSDYRFQPAQGEAGPRMPWGGEMGGVGVDRKGNPGLMLSTAVGDLRQSKARLILNGAPHMHGITTHPNLTDSSSSISSKTSFPKLKDSNVAVSYSILSEYSNSHAPLVEVKRSNKKHKKKNNNSNLPYIEPFVLSVS